MALDSSPGKYMYYILKVFILEVVCLHLLSNYISKPISVFLKDMELCMVQTNFLIDRSTKTLTKSQLWQGHYYFTRS